MMNRLERMNSFLSQNGCADARRSLLAADASFRHYDRLVMNDKTLVLMDAPPPMENVRPFVKIAKHLEKLGYSAPHVHAVDEENGFVLLEDFKDATYTRLLNTGVDEKELYSLAIDVLLDLHQRKESQTVPIGLAKYDDTVMMNEARLFVDWFMPAALQKPMSQKAIAEYENILKGLFPKAKNVPQTLVLRDYHVDNLMRLNHQTGIKACGLLDFQDSLHGSMTYDIMSLLEDARRDISAEIYQTMKKRYLENMGDIIPDQEAFLSSWAVLATQRHAKVLGIFVRLNVRDNKDRYLIHLPRVWRLLEKALQHPDLTELKEWFDTYVPTQFRSIPKSLSKSEVA